MQKNFINSGIKSQIPAFSTCMQAEQTHFLQADAGWARDSACPPQPETETVKVLPFSSGRKPDAAARRAAFDFEALPHINDLYRTACRMTGDPARAEDALQETLLQAWKSFDRFETGTNCRAWLYRILFHCVNHQRRKWFRFPQLKENEEFLQANLVAHESVADQLQDAEILAALDRIPADFRAVVLLVDVEEFAYKETSEILSVPIGTVMSRLSRGRKLLREQLAEVAKAYGIVKDNSKGTSA